MEDNMRRFSFAGLLVLVFFLVSFRAAVIVAFTIPLALLFAFIFMHAGGAAAQGRSQQK